MHRGCPLWYPSHECEPETRCSSPLFVDVCSVLCFNSPFHQTQTYWLVRFYRSDMGEKCTSASTGPGQSRSHKQGAPLRRSTSRFRIQRDATLRLFPMCRCSVYSYPIDIISTLLLTVVDLRFGTFAYPSGRAGLDDTT